MQAAKIGGGPRRACRAAAIVGGLVLALAAPNGAGATETCNDGDVLSPGESCELQVKWGYDHWLVGAFAENSGSQVEFSHVSGDCSVSLFGPTEALLSPDSGPVRSSLPGEYHIFTRAITVAQQSCVYRVSVE